MTKGAPEVLKSLCRTETIPKDFDKQLETLSKQGFRILAMAMKKLEPEFYQTLQNVIDGALELPRDKIESNLQFLGFITFKNNLKPTSIEVIEQLKTANLKSIMVTGDNLETAISVSEEVGIIDSNQDGFTYILRRMTIGSLRVFRNKVLILLLLKTLLLDNFLPIRLETSCVIEIQKMLTFSFLLHTVVYVTTVFYH